MILFTTSRLLRKKAIPIKIGTAIFINSVLENLNYKRALIAAVSFSKPGFSSKANMFFL
jgi:hypothetical protein